MTKPRKAYGQDRTKPIQSIDLGAFSILSFKLMAKYRHLPYDQYREAVALGMELLEEIPERDLKKLLKKGFLSPPKSN